MYMDVHGLPGPQIPRPALIGDGENPRRVDKWWVPVCFWGRQTPIFVSPPPQKKNKIYQAAHFFVYHFLIPQLLFKHFWLILLPSTNPGYYLGKEHPPWPTPPSTKKTRYSHSQSLAEVKRCFCRGFCARLEEVIEKTKKLTQHCGGDRPAGWSLQFAQRIYKVGPC